MTRESSSDTISKITDVLYGEQNVVNTVLQFTSNAKSRIDACVDYTRPSLATGNEQLKKAFLDAKSRGVKLRYVTEVTEENVVYCKELIKMVDELRHLNGIKGNFYISETEYIAPASLHEKGKPASQIIYSNVKEIVEHQQDIVFDSFWSRAVPAEHKIKEIEEGIVHYETKVLQNQDEIFKKIKDFMETSDELLNCSQYGAMQLIYNNFFESCKKISDKYRKGEHRGTRWISNINKGTVELVKIFLDLGVHIRHVKNLPPMNFSIIPNKEMAATVEKMEEGKMIQTLLTSTEPIYVNHFTSIFGELWNQGIDAIERIKDIEEGVDLADIEVIPSSARAQDLYLDIVKSASQEILWIFPTTNAFIRQYKIGALQLAKEVAENKNVKVRILVPANISIEQKIQELKQHCPCCVIDVRYIEQMSETKATILVVDRKASLVMELRDDSKTTFNEAIGLSTYSNSKAGVSSYVAIFENLWRQSELYQNVKEALESLAQSNKQLALANKQLKIHDKMQEEFINIAAHELRTPIQPILGLTQVIRYESKDIKQRELLDVIIRNAQRLQRLANDILDVTKIESNSLQLSKEQFSLNEMILNAIADFRNHIKKEYNKDSVKLVLVSNAKLEEDIFVNADKSRVYQVISNLLSNAIKFTREGDITITVEKKEDEVLVSIKDSGVGIDSEILPRLFTKFARKSETGTGLGLFISKNIIEAHHGGRIWAENNKDGEKGATFYFSLPLTR